MVGAILTLGFPMMIRQSYTLGIISRIILGSMHSGWFPGLILNVWIRNLQTTDCLVDTFLIIESTTRCMGSMGTRRRKMSANYDWVCWCYIWCNRQRVQNLGKGRFRGSEEPSQGPLEPGVTSIGGVIVTKYGWPALFYVSAAMTLIWAITWPGNIHLFHILFRRCTFGPSTFNSPFLKALKNFLRPLKFPPEKLQWQRPDFTPLKTNCFGALKSNQKEVLDILMGVNRYIHPSIRCIAVWLVYVWIW